MRKPVIIHTQTIKGKGYKEAEGVGKEHWHGVGAFDLKTGKSLKRSSELVPQRFFLKSL